MNLSITGLQQRRKSLTINAMSVESSFVQFGSFTLDLARAELYKDGELVHIRHQTANLLIILASHEGKTLSRIELAQHLWGSSEIDFDQRLNAAVRDLRKTLSDDQEPQWIRTVPRKGYRFVNDSVQPDRHRFWTTAVVTAVLGIALTAIWLRPTTETPVVSTTAESLYIQARALLDSGDPSHNATVEGLLESAVAESPGYADAWAALAKLNIYRALPPEVAFKRAKQAVEHALDSNPDHIDALIQASVVAVTWDRDWQLAEHYLERALELAPGSASVFHAFASLKYLRGDYQGGEDMLRKGLAIDPLSIVIHSDLTWYQTVSGNYEDALATCALISKLNNASTNSSGCALYPTLLSGRISDAAIIAKRQLDKSGVQFANGLSDVDVLSTLWRYHLEQAIKAGQQRYIDPVNIASMHARLGEPQQTLEMLEKAVANRSLYAPYIPLFPEFRALQMEQRYIALVEQIGTGHGTSRSR